MVLVLLRREPLRDIVDNCTIDVAGLPVLRGRTRPLAGNEEVIERRIVAEIRLVRTRESGLPESEVFQGDLEVALPLEEKQGNPEPCGLCHRVVVFQIEKV